MKKRNTFDIKKYNKDCKLRQVNFVKHASIAIRHPVTWFFLAVVVVYGFGL